ncbi:multidrug effflux MFS transporter, partial [Thioclava sp. BHET1]
VPAVAPSIGTFIMAGFGWRGIFDVLMIFACLAALWLGLRQPETLAPERRRPLRLRPIAAAFIEVLSHRTVLTVTLAQTMIFGAFFALLSSTPPIFDKAFGEAASFPFWFAAMALSAGLANLVNASLVVRLGMRRLVTAVIALEVILAGLVTLATASGALPLWLGFPAYLLWNAGMLWTATFSLGNLNAMALEPLGHIAGMAAAVNGAVATMAGVLIAIPIGLAFDGTPLPLMLADLGLIVAALLLMLTLPRGTD